MESEIGRCNARWMCAAFFFVLSTQNVQWTLFILGSYRLSGFQFFSFTICLFCCNFAFYHVCMYISIDRKEWFLQKNNRLSFVFGGCSLIFSADSYFILGFLFHLINGCYVKSHDFELKNKSSLVSHQMNNDIPIPH